MIADVAGWIALAATCIAAVMTASNLGARVTGWGFVLFTIGAVSWAIDGFASGQTQLLWSNGFLALVDLFGIWRWLGRRARFHDASRAEEAHSEQEPGDDLLSALRLDGMPIESADGAILGHVTDALVSRADGAIAYLIVREGGTAGIGECLRRLPWQEVQLRGDVAHTQLDVAQVRRLAVVSNE